MLKRCCQFWLCHWGRNLLCCGFVVVRLGHESCWSVRGCLWLGGRREWPHCLLTHLCLNFEAGAGQGKEQLGAKCFAKFGGWKVKRVTSGHPRKAGQCDNALSPCYGRFLQAFCKHFLPSHCVQTPGWAKAPWHSCSALLCFDLSLKSLSFPLKTFLSSSPPV